MGMFDYVIIDTEMLPVSESEKKAIGENPGWQTKDLECDLTEVYITKDGELKICKWDIEEVPKKDRQYPNEEGLLGMVGSFKRVNERLEKIDYNGYINFYSNVNENWYDFFAKFTNGKLHSIDVLKDGCEKYT